MTRPEAGLGGCFNARIDAGINAGFNAGFGACFAVPDCFR
jgi:hypothetical protein